MHKGQSKFFGPGIEQYRFRGKRIMQLRNARFAGGGGTTETEEPATEEEKKLFAKIEKRIAKEIENRGINDKTLAQTMVDAAMVQWKELGVENMRKAVSDVKELQETIKRQAEELEKISNAAVGAVKAINVRSQVEAWQKDNKTALDAIRSKDGTAPNLKALKLNMRAAGTMLVSTNLGTGLPIPQYEAGVTDILRVQPTFWDYIPKGRSSSAVYNWVNKVNPDGAAAFIGEGVQKPRVDFDLEMETSNAKKIADSLKVSTELLYDIDGMTTMIETELKYQLLAKLNTTLMTGVLSSTVPAGIQTISTTYTLTGVQTTNPNNFDAIRALRAQLRVGNFPAQFPVTIFMNPVDIANMELTKANDSGVYMMPPFSSADGKTVAGCTIVEDNNIPAGYVQAAILNLFRVLIYEDYSVSWGWVNDDFEKNLVTAIAEMRIHAFHSDNHAGAFIYDTLANIKTAITVA